MSVAASVPPRDPLPFAVLFEPEPELPRVRVRVASSLRSGAAINAIGVLLGRNWLGSMVLTIVVQFPCGLRLSCPPDTVEDVPDDAPAVRVANVVDLASWRRSAGVRR